MLLSRLIADFNRGESDALRKAMGIRKQDKLAELKLKFIKGGMNNGYKRAHLKEYGRTGNTKVCTPSTRLMPFAIHG